jgi:hypothetical protein
MASKEVSSIGLRGTCPPGLPASAEPTAPAAAEITGGQDLKWAISPNPSITNVVVADALW